MKVTLVGINAKFIHSNLAVRYLKAYTEDLEYQCSIREFSINDRVERVVEELIKEESDVIAFSCYIWNIEFIKAVANIIKVINKDIEIIYGGPEVSFNGKDFLENNPGEYLIEGEGEKTFRELILYKLELKKDPNREEDSYLRLLLKNIKGLYYKERNKVYYGGIRSNMDINDVVFSYTKEEELNNKIVYYEASRGCPFGCKYCLSSVDRKVRFRDIEKIKSELKFLIDKKVRLIKFVDRTFNCKESFAMDIWKFIIEQNTETKFHFEISADLLTEDEINLLSKAPKGRIQFEVGVQTTNNEILKNIDRHVNFSKIKEKVEEVKKLKNISQHLDLIAGLPGEDFQSFKNSFNNVYTMEPEEIQLGFLKILKGSPMSKEASKWGMKYSPYPPYEILKTNKISYLELIELKKVEAVVDKYYNSGKFNTILKYFISKFNTPFDFYYSLGMFFQEKGYFDRNISASDYYNVFLKFNCEKLKENNFILREIIKYDYLMFNKKRGIPNFLKDEISKAEIKSIKEKIFQRGFKFEKNGYHIEKFNIDVLNFINNSNILKKEIYLVYNHNNDQIVQYID
ncbi:B12-binding domain-containing radical SAM protein [Clostridium sp. MB40-C1]|uniref:B12-binding domain-containing radical SAM protein n=1 Tax=Clostridium sp. MB40-C1 TaxID=3070996 RepID=UPI0027E045C0|nr:B12-binding domain-containing radical SAM protein [Clostridium sp. MB40-C1]WMJ79216.1 B12-binding domain-containing radical SAM protein [Clostridium sp. MB40-C1]